MVSVRREDGVEIEGMLAHDQGGKQDLRHRVEFGDQQRPYRHRPAHHPGEQESADDHDIARHDKNDEEDRQRAGDAERNVNRHDERLVGQRIEVFAELARHVEVFGEEAVDGIADPGRQEQEKGNTHLSRRDRPDHDRHQQNPPQRNEIWDTQTAPRRIVVNDAI